MPSYIRNPTLMQACASGQHSEPTTPDSFSFADDEPAEPQHYLQYDLTERLVSHVSGDGMAESDSNLLLPADPNLLLPYNDFDIA